MALLARLFGDGPGWNAVAWPGHRGKPRAVNNLAIAALIGTYAAGKNIAGQSAARAAINE